ncbi:uncharacterized protein LOC144142410 isoform X2 [Haemaphysalis longicornis]
MSTVDKEAQCCTSRLRCAHGTQTDPTTVHSASCQTEAAFPGVDVLEAGVFHQRPHKSFHQKRSADRHSNQQDAAMRPVRTTKNSLQAQEEIRPGKECNHASHFGSQSSGDEASLGSRGREHMVQETEPLNVCQEHFPRRQQLVAHRELPHRCKVCEKCFSRESELVEHARMHTGEQERYPCRFCHRCYATKQSLDVHEKTHRGDPKPYVCNVCQKRFSRTLLLVAHWKLHTGETLPHSCPVCEKHFSRKRDLVKHAKMHTIEKYCYCRFCQQRFTKKRGLEVHERTCTGDLSPFVCNVCEKRLSTKADLVDHIRDHASERPFGCSVCPAHFRLKYQLSLHMKAHAEGKAKAYICPNCRETFARRCDLSAHIRQHIVPAPVHSCSACGKHFLDKGSLTNHERHVHTSA